MGNENLRFESRQHPPGPALCGALPARPRCSDRCVLMGVAGNAVVGGRDSRSADPEGRGTAAW